VKLCDLIQVEVIRDNFAVIDFGQLDELHVDVTNVREIILYNLHVELRHFLDSLQNIEASPPPVPLH